MPATIREYRSADAAAIRACIVELQEFERAIDARLRPGEAIASEFLDDMLASCRTQGGTILVAEHDAEIAGFATILTRVPYKDLDDPPGTYAQVSDLVVRENARRKGVGEALLREAEQRAIKAGATELRVSVLSENPAALALYERLGLKPYLTTLSKRL